MKSLLSFVLLAALAAPAGCSSSKPAPLEIKGRRIDIKASISGYEPNVINVKPGEQVTLVLNRVTPSECLAEFDIPTANVAEQLTVNEPKGIPYKAPDQPGDVEFICGMKMV